MPEIILTLIREQIVVIISTLTVLLTGIATIVLFVIGDFGRGGRTGGSPPKDNETLKTHSKHLQEIPLKHCLLLWEVLLVQF